MDFTIFLAQSYLYPLRRITLKTKVVERLFFPENKGAFLVLATCSWEACEVDVPLKGCGGSFAPLLGDIAGLQP